ncbi:MAG: hypothetical protein AB7F51_08900, partial [Pseudorhodoplanes sp.]
YSDLVKSRNPTPGKSSAVGFVVVHWGCGPVGSASEPTAMSINCRAQSNDISLTDAAARAGHNTPNGKGPWSEDLVMPKF